MIENRPTRTRSSNILTEQDCKEILCKFKKQKPIFSENTKINLNLKQT